MITIYHNPKCRVSRAGLEYLKAKGVEFKVVEYLRDPFTREQLKELLMKLNLNPHDLIRTQEDIYKTRFRGKMFTNEEWISILLEYPKLMRRPVVARGYKAVVAIPADEMDRLFE